MSQDDDWDDFESDDDWGDVEDFKRCDFNSLQNSVLAVNNTAHELLVYGYLNCIYFYRFSPPSSIINLCFMFYFDQNVWNQIHIFVNDRIETVSTNKQISDSMALSLLLQHKWDVDDIVFKNKDKYDIIIKNNDNVKDNIVRTKNKVKCNLCNQSKYLYQLQCGHGLCSSCWMLYLQAHLDNNQCLFLTCQNNKCNIILISMAIWKQFLHKIHEIDYQRYLRYIRQHCIDNNKQFIQLICKSCGKCKSVYYSCNTLENMPTNIVVTCDDCCIKFCFGCKDTPHQPASCKMMKKWLHKCASETETISRISVKVKRCPKCYMVMQKNQGCNVMTCPRLGMRCGHKFCWLCKGDAHMHPHYSYPCNIFEREEVERFEFHYTRFDSHSNSAKYAIKLKESTLTGEKLHKLAQEYEWSLNEARFLLEAVNTTSECWDLLAWTYPLMYYLSDKKINMGLFVEQQGKLEQFCDGLQQRLDFDLDKVGDIKTRQEIIGYTRTVNVYRKNLLEYFEEIRNTILFA